MARGFQPFVVANPVKGWRPDLPPHKLDRDMWSLAENVRFYNGRVEKVRGWASVGATATGTPGLICRARFSNGDDLPIVCTDRYIYKMASNYALTQLNAVDYVASAHSRWEHDSFPDANFFNRTDGGKQIQKYDGTTLDSINAAGWGSMQLTSGYSAPPRGKSLAQFYSHLLLGSLTSDGLSSIDLQSIASSDIAAGDEPNGEMNWDFTDEASDAVILSAFEGNDPVQRILPLSDYLVVYKEFSIHLLTYSGGTFTYARQIPERWRGTPCPHSVIGVRRVHYYIGQDNIYAFNGSEPVPIGDGVYNTFLARVMPDDRRDLWVFDDTLRKEINWVGRDNLALVYNYENGTFALRWFPFSAAGYVNLTLESTDWVPSGVPDPEDWSQWLEDWMTPSTLNNLSILGAKSDGTLHRLFGQGEYQTNGDDLDSLLESPDFDFGDPSSIKQCNEMRLEGTTLGTNPMEVYAGIRDNLGADIGWNGPYTVSNNRATFVHSARWFRFRFQKRGGDFSLERYTPFIRRRGRF